MGASPLYMKTLKIVGAGIGCFVALIAFLFAVGVVDLAFLNFFAPKQAEVQRKVFEQGKSYRHGTIQELDKMKQEYFGTKDPDHRSAILARANRMTAEIGKENLPSDISQWLYSVEAK